MNLGRQLEVVHIDDELEVIELGPPDDADEPPALGGSEKRIDGLVAGTRSGPSFSGFPNEQRMPFP